MCLKTGRPEAGVEDAVAVPEAEGISVGVEAGVAATGVGVGAAVAVAFPPAQAPTTTEIASATNAIARLARKRILMARLWPTDGRLSSTCRMSLETVTRHKKSGRRVEAAATVLPVGGYGSYSAAPAAGPLGEACRPARAACSAWKWARSGFSLSARTATKESTAAPTPIQTELAMAIEKA